MSRIMVSVLLLSTLLGCSRAADAPSGEAPATKADKNLLYAENFDHYPDGAMPEDWWAEGGVRVWVENKRLRTDADPDEPGRVPGIGLTVFNRQVFSGDLRVEFDVHVISSSINANNMNFLLFTSDPEGRPLEETRETRKDGTYSLYHNLNGYIFTFVNERNDRPEARFRFRRCPGFELLSETFALEARVGSTYHIAISRKGNRLAIAVDGKEILSAIDEAEPWREGLIGLRTFRSDLWWDNFKITRLD